MDSILRHTVLILFSSILLFSCVSVEKRHCDSSKKGNKKKMKQLRSNGGFNMGSIEVKKRNFSI